MVGREAADHARHLIHLAFRLGGLRRDLELGLNLDAPSLFFFPDDSDFCFLTMLAEIARHTVLLIFGVRDPLQRTCHRVGRPLDALGLRHDSPRDVEDVRGGSTVVSDVQ